MFFSIKNYAYLFFLLSFLGARNVQAAGNTETWVEQLLWSTVVPATVNCEDWVRNKQKECEDAWKKRHPFELIKKSSCHSAPLKERLTQTCRVARGIATEVMRKNFWETTYEKHNAQPCSDFNQSECLNLCQFLTADLIKPMPLTSFSTSRPKLNLEELNDFKNRICRVATTLPLVVSAPGAAPVFPRPPAPPAPGVRPSSPAPVQGSSPTASLVPANVLANIPNPPAVSLAINQLLGTLNTNIAEYFPPGGRKPFIIPSVQQVTTVMNDPNYRPHLFGEIQLEYIMATQGSSFRGREAVKELASTPSVILTIVPQGSRRKVAGGSYKWVLTNTLRAHINAINGNIYPDSEPNPALWRERVLVLPESDMFDVSRAASIEELRENFPEDEWEQRAVFLPGDRPDRVPPLRYMSINQGGSVKGNSSYFRNRDIVPGTSETFATYALLGLAKVLINNAKLDAYLKSFDIKPDNILVYYPKSVTGAIDPRRLVFTQIDRLTPLHTTIYLTADEEKAFLLKYRSTPQTHKTIGMYERQTYIASTIISTLYVMAGCGLERYHVYSKDYIRLLFDKIFSETFAQWTSKTPDDLQFERIFKAKVYGEAAPPSTLVKGGLLSGDANSYCRAAKYH